MDIPQLEVDPKNGSIVYILLPSRLIYQTSDAAISWKNIGAGLKFKKEVHTLTIDPQDSQVLYAGGSEGIFRSNNNGKTWTSQKCDCYIWDLAIDPANHRTVYGVGEGALKSVNGGKTWEWFSPHPYLSGVLLGIGVHPKNSNLVFVAGFGGGIFRSENGGQSWKTVNEKLDALSIVRLEAGADPQERIFAVGGQQSFESRDGGETWELFMKGQASTFWVSDIAVHKKNPDLIVAAGNRKKLGAIVLSTNGGKSWKTLSKYQGVNYGCTGCIALDPKNQNVMYLTPFQKENKITTSLGVAKSIDRGNNWKLINKGITKKDVWIVAIHPADSNFLLAGTGTGKLFRSSNAGEQWEESSQGLDTTSIRSIAFDPENLSVMYVATYSSLFKSINGGKSWEILSKELPESWFNYIGLDPHSTQTVYATGGAGIFVSENGGRNWERLQTGNPGSFAVWNLLISPGGTPEFYAGTDRGVFKMKTTRTVRAEK